jgi:uncharacterized C2H2 Zn-finger protein
MTPHKRPAYRPEQPSHYPRSRPMGSSNYDTCKASKTETRDGQQVTRRCSGMAFRHDKDSDHYDGRGSWRQDGKPPFSAKK